MKILLTAFDPFGGAMINPAELAVERVAAPDGAELIKLLLPTSFTRAPAMLRDAVLRESPDAVVCVGLAEGRDAVTPERVAINVMDARIADNDGDAPTDEAVIPGAPSAYFSTLPIKKIASAINAAGVPAKISNTAGTFVCNALMFSLLHTLNNYLPNSVGGFIHIPATPEMPGEYPKLPLEKSVAALETALKVLVFPAAL